MRNGTQCQMLPLCLETSSELLHKNRVGGGAEPGPSKASAWGEPWNQLEAASPTSQTAGQRSLATSPCGFLRISSKHTTEISLGSFKILAPVAGAGKRSPQFHTPATSYPTLILSS